MPSLDSRLSAEWPGQIRILFAGRVVTGSDAKVPLIALLMQIMGMAGFFASPGAYLLDKAQAGSVVVVVIAVVLSLLSLYFFVRTSLSDPGFLPRAEPRLGPADTRPPRTQNIVAQGKLPLRYCEQCNIFRPPRAAHCIMSNSCVLRFDHHCPWVGNCIGARNYRYFYGFVMNISLLALLVIGSCVAEVVLKTEEYKESGNTTVGEHQALSSSKALERAVADSVLTLLMLVYTLLMSLFVVSLWCFHSYLLCRNLTTNESLKSSFGTVEGNPHGWGFRQIFRTLCGPRPPSYVRRWCAERRSAWAEAEAKAKAADADERTRVAAALCFEVPLREGGALVTLGGGSGKGRGEHEDDGGGGGDVRVRAACEAAAAAPGATPGSADRQTNLRTIPSPSAAPESATGDVTSEAMVHLEVADEQVDAAAAVDEDDDDNHELYAEANSGGLDCPDAGSSSSVENESSVAALSPV